MDAIWIIIVIIAVIMRVINKGEDFKGKLPEEWGDNKVPPILKDWGFPWDEEPEQNEKLPENQPERTHNEEEVSLAEAYVKAYDIEESNIKSIDKALSGHPLLNTDNVISGIIMSELLQPPKSKRIGWRKN